MLKTVFTLLLLTAAVSSSACAAEVQTERALREACSSSPEGMTPCLQKQQQASAENLQRAENMLNDRLQRWDEDAKYRGQAKQAQKAAARTFADYRQQQCAFAASLGGGAIGHALEMRRLACVAELNNRRAEQLRAAADTLALK